MLSTFTVTALPVSTVSFFGFAVGALVSTIGDVVSLGLTVTVGSCVGVTDDVGFNVSFAVDTDSSFLLTLGKSIPVCSLNNT